MAANTRSGFNSPTLGRMPSDLPKNSLIPIITLLGIAVGMVIAGSVLVEMVFAIPGVGRLIVSSLFAQDYVVKVKPRPRAGHLPSPFVRWLPRAHGRWRAEKASI